MKKNKKKIVILISILLLLFICSVYIVINTKNKVEKMFKLNQQRQQQGYYMADFEYKLLGIIFYLDKGKYIKAFSLLNRYYNQLKTGVGLIKIPEFKNKEEEIDFYLSLQNPKTGAFMDEDYPPGTYHGPTENVLLHIQSLCDSVNIPLKLKYRLNYLDQINTSDKLLAFLDNVGTVGILGSLPPQTSFHFARDYLSLARDREHYNEEETQMVILKNNLYDFSDKWRRTLLEWFYQNQDTDTGLWGPKDKNNRLLKKDVNNSSSIMKAFVDKNGNNIHKEFPLRYKDRLFRSFLEELEKYPDPEASLDKWHEWHLKQLKGLRTLTRYLWKDVSEHNRLQTEKLIGRFITALFENHYITEQGSFSYYPGGKDATVDGLGGFLIFREIGAYSYDRQKELWGNPVKNILITEKIYPKKISVSDFNKILNDDNINSIRFYIKEPGYDNLISDISFIFYPVGKKVLDIANLIPGVRKWLNNTDQSVGNWVSKNDILNHLNSLNIENKPVYRDIIPIDYINKLYRETKHLTVIGIDKLQIPRYKINFDQSS